MALQAEFTGHQHPTLTPIVTWRHGLNPMERLGPCPLCAPLVDRSWKAGTGPLPPLHPNCDCFVDESTSQADIPHFIWTQLPTEAYNRLINWLAWLYEHAYLPDWVPDELMPDIRRRAGQSRSGERATGFESWDWPAVRHWDWDNLSQTGFSLADRERLAKITDISPITLEKMPTNEVLSLHRRTHQLWALHFEETSAERVGTLVREDVWNAHQMIVEEMRRRSMQHDSELARAGFSHHWLTQPRDWHGRWMDIADTLLDGLPLRCYSSPAWGSPQAYADMIEQLVNGQIGFNELTAARDQGRTEARRLARELQDVNSAIHDLEGEQNLTEKSTLILGAATAIYAGLTGAALIEAGGAMTGAIQLLASGTTTRLTFFDPWTGLPQVFPPQIATALGAAVVATFAQISAGVPGGMTDDDLQALAREYGRVFERSVSESGSTGRSIVESAFNLASFGNYTPNLGRLAYLYAWREMLHATTQHLQRLDLSYERAIADANELAQLPEYANGLRRRIEQIREDYRNTCIQPGTTQPGGPQ